MIAVKRGEVYRVPRRGKQAVFVRIIGVRKGQQPKITHVQICRGSFRRKTGLPSVRWLQFYDRAWRLPAEWSRVND